MLRGWLTLDGWFRGKSYTITIGVSLCAYIPPDVRLEARPPGAFISSPLSSLRRCDSLVAHTHSYTSPSRELFNQLLS